MQDRLPKDCDAALKLELFQQSGSFKARGVLLHMDALSDQERQAGVTAFSAGNHALAVSWAGQETGVSAKIVMPAHADPIRVAGCRALGAEIELVDSIHAALARMEEIAEQEGRTIVHPFEGPYMALGAASLGAEIAHQMPDLDAMVVPVGGGGLIAGISHAMDYLQPNCRLIGVEPTGADSMSQSLRADEPITLPAVDTIADSLASPKALPYSFRLAQKHIDEMVQVTDDAMCDAMALLYDALKIACEPACAATTAAACGPLREKLAGQRIGLIACGSNIGESRLLQYLETARKSPT